MDLFRLFSNGSRNHPLGALIDIANAFNIALKDLFEG